jgi:hypothetical protein
MSDEPTEATHRLHECSVPDCGHAYWEKRPADDPPCPTGGHQMLRKTEVPTETDDLPALLRKGIRSGRMGWRVPNDVLRRSAAHIQVLEDKVKRLEARGITDMQHRIAELEARVKRLSGAATDEVLDLRAEVARLTAWKAEATTVFDEWELVWDALGRPGPLGSSKARASLDKINQQGEQE